MSNVIDISNKKKHEISEVLCKNAAEFIELLPISMKNEVGGIVIVAWDYGANSSKCFYAPGSGVIQMRLIPEFVRQCSEDAYFELMEEIYREDE